MNFEQSYLFSNFNTLCFKDKECEAEFDEWQIQPRLEQISAISILTASLYLVYALIDWFIAPKPVSTLMISVHAGILAPTLFLIAYLAKNPKNYTLVMHLLFYAAIFAASANILMTSSLSSANLYASELYLIIFWVFTVSGLHLYKATLSAFIIFLMVVLSALSYPLERLIMTAFWSFSAFSFGFLGAYLLERLHKNAFMHEQNLSALAQTDALTGLYNRAKLNTLLEDEFKRMHRLKHSFACVFIDIDYFKEVNDTFGHKVGDEILIEVAKLMLCNTREIDSVIRWGGEEFVIVCVESDKEGMMHFCEDLRLSVEKHIFPKVNHLSISIGFTLCVDNDTVDSIIHRADKALYLAKENGRNRIEYLEG